MFTLAQQDNSAARAVSQHWNVSGVSAPTTPLPVTNHATCRVCGSADLQSYLDLGDQPLANALRDPDDISPEFRAPLVLCTCLSCTLSQLSVVVDPKRLYTEYAYYSGVNPAWHTHCASLCDTLEPLEGKFVLEIASNDGTFLKEADRRGAVTLGVEPAGNFLRCGYPLLNAFWTREVALRRTILSRVDYLVAQNVLGHVDDVHNFMEAIELCLAPEGRTLIEVPWLVNLVQNNAFDTVYHEHLSYWTVQALQHLAQQHGLTVNAITRLPDIHGGSIRASLSRSPLVGKSVARCYDAECAILPDAYQTFQARVNALVADIDQQMPSAAFGAAAKATVLLNLLKNPPSIVYDETPSKVGKQMPGVHSNIRAPSRLEFAAAPQMALLAWNWAEALKQKARGYGFTGRFFTPLPTPRWDSP